MCYALFQHVFKKMWAQYKFILDGVTHFRTSNSGLRWVHRGTSPQLSVYND